MTTIMDDKAAKGNLEATHTNGSVAEGDLEHVLGYKPELQVLL